MKYAYENKVEYSTLDSNENHVPSKRQTSCTWYYTLSLYLNSTCSKFCYIPSPRVAATFHITIVTLVVIAISSLVNCSKPPTIYSIFHSHALFNHAETIHSKIPTSTHAVNTSNNLDSLNPKLCTKQLLMLLNNTFDSTESDPLKCHDLQHYTHSV